MLHFSITTPERKLLDEKVESVTVPTELGEITVLQNHIPLVANLTAGELHYTQNGETKFLAVSSGFIEVKKGNELVVLADTAEFSHEIDPKRAETARDEARKLMESTYSDQNANAEAIAILEKNLVRLRVSHKHRTKTHLNIDTAN
jgi:F-type H+-transporting ATPase subunit epsilon